MEKQDDPSLPDDIALPDELTFAFLSRIGRRLVHELNNSIGAISSSAFIVKDIMNSADGRADDEGIQPFIEGIEEESDKLKCVVEEFSKYISTMSVLKMPIDIAEFITNRADEMAGEGLPVRTVATDKEIFIEGDAGALGISIRNIVNYAVSEGASSVTTSIEDGDDCVIVIRDNRAAPASPSELRDAFSPIPSGERSARGL